MQIDYFGALRRNWHVLATVLFATILTSVIATALQDRIYESSAQLVVSPTTAPMDPSDTIRAVETLERRTVVATFARMASAPDVLTALQSELKLTKEQARGLRITGSVIPSTNIIRIDVRGSDPRVAADAANIAADITARNAASLYRVYELRFLSRAVAPAAPVHPDRRRNLLVGATLGLVLGFAAALAADRLRRSAAVGAMRT